MSSLRTFSCGLLVASFLASAGIADASSYGLRATESAERVGRELVEQQLLTELAALLGHGASHERLARIEDAMRPMFNALPRSKDGGVDQGVARYALNRYFLTQHGWHIIGIAPDGERWNASSSTTMLKSRMPSFILEFLEERVGRTRLGLGELAVLAATVEDLVRSDGLAVLRMAYEAHNLSTNEPLEDEEKENLILKTFMLFFTMPWTQKARDSQSVNQYLQNVHKANPAWSDTMLWIQDMKQSATYQHVGERNPFSTRRVFFGDYPSMVHFVEQIIDGYGVYQDMQCKELKNVMMDLEDEERSDGRVLLANLYRPYLEGTHRFFTERPEFLEQLGSLDNSDPVKPSVIVPNYIYGRQFCLASQSDFQSFCCVDQCNVLMESLERSIARPVASPGLIAELVATLPSDTVAAPRDLSASLRRKLDLIAEQHDGHVPLHGRMFAQFMHHAFPNECQQPRAPGATEAQMTHDQWRANRNISTMVSKKVMRKLMDAAAGSSHLTSQEEPSMRWTEEEELLTSLDLASLGGLAKSQQSEEGVLGSVLRLAAMGTVAVSTFAIVQESLRSSARLLWPQGAKRQASCAGDLPRWASSMGKSHFV